MEIKSEQTVEEGLANPLRSFDNLLTVALGNKKGGKKMKNISIKVFIGIFILCIFIPVAQAETPFDITSCVTGPATVLSSSEELVILGVEFKGIIMSNHENKVFDNFISHFVGVSRIMGGQVDARGYTKLTDLNGGDFIFTETTYVGPIGKTTWKWKHAL